jgi:hypothetical protein
MMSGKKAIFYLAGICKEQPENSPFLCGASKEKLGRMLL